MAVLVLKDGLHTDGPDDLARRAEDLVDAAENRAAETLAYKKMDEAYDANEANEKAALASPAEPPELDQHGRVIKK
jgi:hypothetical protein